MKKSLLAALLLLLSFTTAPAVPSAPDSLSIKIGQMLMIGFRGLNAIDDPAFAEALQEGKIGGVVLFDYDVPSKSPIRNIESPEQVRQLTEKLQRLAPTPLFIAVDQEGGRVCRLKTARGFPPTVSAAHLGKLDNADSTRQASGATAKLLESLGINMNLAPVVDLNINPNNPVIGKLDRSFSSNPTVVTRQATIFVDTFHRNGIIAALKHFPGHGSSTTDTHKDFTDVTETWSETELEPYRTLIGNGYDDPVMTAHVFNAKLDSRYPATLSKASIDGLLRKQLGFRGVVISDDMQMKAIADRYGLAQAIRLAIDAGVDVLLFGNNAGIYDPEIAEKANAIIRRLVEKGDITPERIDASYRQIMTLKQRTITPAP
ncbi:MAG TPA: glycoside hydrolase family 3 [Chlorobaculum parvum]|uniref:beta-N-acetylhexosaminidase n=1 Tax=Chlorobaculum parvum TaxID=274539 RepID=A0A7C5DES1_9CHLB|nr:glycoside hydrolase family 3 [Chlorobaculum parvum]